MITTGDVEIGRKVPRIQISDLNKRIVTLQLASQIYQSLLIVIM